MSFSVKPPRYVNLQVPYMDMSSLRIDWNSVSIPAPWQYCSRSKTVHLHGVQITAGLLSRSDDLTETMGHILLDHFRLRVAGKPGLTRPHDIDQRLKARLDRVIPPNMRNDAYRSIGLSK